MKEFQHGRNDVRTALKAAVSIHPFDIVSIGRLPLARSVCCTWQVVRVVDYDEQALVAGFKSWFGGILCLDWSPDGRYIVTGGEVRERERTPCRCFELCGTVHSYVPSCGSAGFPSPPKA